MKRSGILKMIARYLAVGLPVRSPAARRVWVANAEKSEGQHSHERQEIWKFDARRRSTPR
jgi:hypothetical protein